MRVDEIIYNIIGSPIPRSPPINFTTQGGVNLTSANVTVALANITNTVVSPTHTIFYAVAGPMQVNFTILNPVEVHFQLLKPFALYLPTILARRLGQAIHTVLLPFPHCHISRQFGS